MSEAKFKETEIGFIPEDWELKTVEEVAFINESSIKKDFELEFIEYIDIASVDKGIIENKQILELNEAPSRAKRIVRDNDILISTVRPNLKHYAFINSANPNTIASTGFAVISAKKINPNFLYYYLTTDKYTNYLTAIADSHTSAYPSFNPDIIEKSQIPFPSKDEQNSIAKILSDLDKKIELNQKMNQTMEEIGQAIFKHWFVHFEFPNEEGKPYKSSGGEMVDSELGEIPKGWNVTKLGDLCEVKGGKRLPKGHKLIEDQTSHPYIRVTDLSNNTVKLTNLQYLDEETFKQISRYVIGKEDLYISIVGTIGLVGLIPKELDGANLTENCAKITNLTTISKEYLFFFLNSSYGQEQIKMLTVGSTQGKLALYRIKEIKIPIPNDQNLLNNAESSFSSIWKTKEHNITQNKFLSEIRDSILPKLMSGKLRLGSELVENR